MSKNTCPNCGLALSKKKTTPAKPRATKIDLMNKIYATYKLQGYNGKMKQSLIWDDLKIKLRNLESDDMTLKTTLNKLLESDLLTNPSIMMLALIIELK